MARTIAEGSGMKNAQLIIFEQSGHSPQVEEKILFRETVARFLNQILI
jgi:pimeloyl-ACP methyl ester carboxylesterase